MEVYVAENNHFERDGMDVYTEEKISFTTAALGGPIRVQTVDGQIEYDVKPGTQTGTKVRLKNKGIPNVRNKEQRGDHYMILTVEVPTNLNNKQKEALQAFAETMSDSHKKKGFFK